MNKIQSRISLIGVLVSLTIGVSGITLRPSLASAETKGIDFDENYHYDIYFDYEMVKGVKILGVKEIQGEVFLAIATSNLKTKDTEGYIRFDTIKAILPSGYINVNAFDVPYPAYQSYK